MELSDLCWFNNKMYSFDDRSGIGILGPSAPLFTLV